MSVKLMQVIPHNWCPIKKESCGTTSEHFRRFIFWGYKVSTWGLSVKCIEFYSLIDLCFYGTLLLDHSPISSSPTEAAPRYISSYEPGLQHLPEMSIGGVWLLPRVFFCCIHSVRWQLQNNEIFIHCYHKLHLSVIDQHNHRIVKMKENDAWF